MSLSFRRLTAAFLLTAAFACTGCPVPDRMLFSTPGHSLPPPVDLPLIQIPFLSEGYRLNGWFLPGLPGRPLVLYFHGTATDLSREAENLRRLRDRLGVSVFAFDYRGFGESRGNPTVEGTDADARAALAQVRKRGWGSEGIVYYGRSLGAAVALRLAVEAPPAGVVLESAFTSILDLVAWHHPTAGTWLSWVMPDFYNNLKTIPHVRAPVFLIHGGRDAVAPPEMSARLFERAPEPKTFVVLRGGDHDNPREGGEERYWNLWARFLLRCSSTPAGTLADR